LDGYIPTENIRTRPEPLKFKQGETADDMIAPKTRDFTYPAMTKTLGGFKLEVESGGFSDSEIVVLVGENGMGKTTFVQMLAGKFKPDNETDADQLGWKVSLKPQTSKPAVCMVLCCTVVADQGCNSLQFLPSSLVLSECCS
jgi:ATP-binding cassette subfamily E protein 1